MIPTKKTRVSRRLVVTKTQLAALNAALARHGYGAANAVPIVLNSSTALLKSTDDEIDRYLIDFGQMDTVMWGIVQRLIAAHAPATTTHAEAVPELLVTRSSKLNRDRYEYGVAVVIQANRRTIIINRLVAIGYTTANTRFFTQGLSLSGSAPIQAYGDRWKLDRSFRDEVKTLADTSPTSELWIWASNQESLDLARGVFGVEYQNDDRQNRTKARVRVVDNAPTASEVLTTLNLRVIT